MGGQTQVIIAAESQQRVAVHDQIRTLTRLHHTALPPQMGVVQFG